MILQLDSLDYNRKPTLKFYFGAIELFFPGTNLDNKKSHKPIT
jgi:hypothetical protein